MSFADTYEEMTHMTHHLKKKGNYIKPGIGIDIRKAIERGRNRVWFVSASFFLQITDIGSSLVRHVIGIKLYQGRS